MKEMIKYKNPIWQHGYGGRLNHLAIGSQEHSTGAYRAIFACGAFSDFARGEDHHKGRCTKCRAAQQKMQPPMVGRANLTVNPSPPPLAANLNRWADSTPEVIMKISENMSIEDLVAIVFDEDDEYSWSSKSEARNAIIRKFNAAQQSVQPTPSGRGDSARSRIRKTKSVLPAKSG